MPGVFQPNVFQPNVFQTSLAATAEATGGTAPLIHAWWYGKEWMWSIPWRWPKRKTKDDWLLLDDLTLGEHS
jgi:hypothetical protein